MTASAFPLRPAPTDSGEPVPPRVLAAEARRDFRERLAGTSLGCPLKPGCGHLLSEHNVDDWDDRGDPVAFWCRYCDCEVRP